MLPTIPLLQEGERFLATSCRVECSSLMSFCMTTASLEDRINPLEHRMGTIETRMDGLDSRMDGLENRMDGLDNRMGALEYRMGTLEIGIGKFETEVRAWREEMRAHYATKADLERVKNDITWRIGCLIIASVGIGVAVLRLWN